MENTTDRDVRAHHRHTNISPFLVNASTPRTGEDRLPGYYCEQQQMWVIETEQGALPIINEQALSQLKTKTRADGEEDDDCHLALELVTKTHQQIESDDDTRPTAYNNFLYLATKTDSIDETDDNCSAAQLLELVTKTKVQQEADDDAIQSFGFHC
ncbi:TPA: hypothetical protein ACNRRD_002115 [Pseudomonas aeruginosa]|nr:MULTISPECIES: hypothetical protein [Pseudomonas]EQM82751.1 hypothetical protein L683_04115 [Pseudomonas aeruginosa WC55]ETD87213.1 hypothetical protein V527_14880 [Pseudomonas aeruginosa VRFPA06]MBB4851541.1 hypothetical protein [Pseudomonas aeruginosa]MCC0146943.1 hypothetical protein [Pseudomonas aeruginosa]MCM8577481.1 hypothetical protein [Pseudomonas aeruginosa]